MQANQIIVRFTQIDPNEPNRVFQFRIRIDSVTDRYLGTVSSITNVLLLVCYSFFRLMMYAITSPLTDLSVDECNEDVPSFDDLVMDLNATGDLSFFIRSMRRQFKQIAL